MSSGIWGKNLLQHLAILRLGKIRQWQLNGIPSNYKDVLLTLLSMRCNTRGEEPEEGWAEEEHGMARGVWASFRFVVMPLFMGVLLGGAACSVLSEGNKEL